MPVMKTYSRPSRTADKFVIRFPDGLRGPLEDVAEKKHRSTNSEIVVRLLESLEREILKKSIRSAWTAQSCRLPSRKCCNDSERFHGSDRVRSFRWLSAIHLPSDKVAE